MTHMSARTPTRIFLVKKNCKEMRFLFYTIKVTLNKNCNYLT